jgi:hypothetical protein
MARNAASAYGRDIRCVRDADELWTSVVGIDVVRQSAIHRLTTDDVLGDDGTGSLVIVGWGFDCRRLLGLPGSRLAAFQPVLVEVLHRDERIQYADVRLERVITNGVEDVRISVEAQTAEGPFSFVRNVSDITADDLVGQA